MKKILGGVSAGILLAVSAAVLAVEPPNGDAGLAPDSVRLEDMVITAPAAPLDAALLRLRALLDTSAPCLGCDASALPTRENVVLGLVRFILLPAVPPELDEAGRVLAGVRCAQAGPAMDYRCR